MGSLSETTTRILGRLGTTLLHAEYFKANDSAEITIAPPLGVPVVRVTLTLQGAIDLDEPIHYNVGSDGKLEFSLSETTTRILGRLGTTLLHAEYFKANDSAEITIRLR